MELTQGNYRSFIESKNRAVRESAYKTLYAAYTNLKNTLSASYSASVKADVFYSRARKYESAIGMALYGSNVPLSVYDGLIDAVESRLPTLGKYLDLRRKALGVDELGCTISTYLSCPRCKSVWSTRRRKRWSRPRLRRSGRITPKCWIPRMAIAGSTSWKTAEKPQARIRGARTVRIRSCS